MQMLGLGWWAFVFLDKSGPIEKKVLYKTSTPSFVTPPFLTVDVIVYARGAVFKLPSLAAIYISAS